MRIVAGPVRMSGFQKFARQRRIGTFLGPAERQKAIVFYRRVAANKAGGEVPLGIEHQLFENLNLILACNRVPRLVAVMRLVSLVRWRRDIGARLEKFGGQWLAVF